MEAYISMPISGHDIRKRKEYAEKVKNLLLSRTIIDKVTTPFDIDDYEEDKAWEWYLARDLQVIMRCDCIIVLPGWGKSLGCKLEIEWSKLNDKKIITTSSEILKLKKQ